MLRGVGTQAFSLSKLAVRLAFVLTLSAGILGILSVSAWAQRQAQPLKVDASGTCSRSNLAIRPGWTISSSWTDQGSKLLVVDARYNQILQYSETGRALGKVSKAIGTELENFFPSTIKPHRSNLLVELANGRMVTLDPSLRPLSKRNVLTEGVQNGAAIRSMFQWDVATSDLIAFSDIQGPGANEWRTAFLRVPLAAPEQFTLLQPLQHEPMRTLMRLGQPYIATLGDTAYFLIADGTMRIYKNEKGTNTLEPLTAFPAGSDLTPILPRFKEFSDFATAMLAVERSSMPVGLYGWEGFLYVVSRTPGSTGTRWVLTRIDPRADQVVGSVALPLEANHLVVAPGPRRWAFVEKGPVESLGIQDTVSIFFIPSEQIRGPLQGSSLCD